MPFSDPQGSPLAEDDGKPVSFAAVGSYAMGAMGTGLVYIRYDSSSIIRVRVKVFIAFPSSQPS